MSLNISKMLKTDQFFSCDFLFLKMRCFLAIMATVDLKHLIFKNEKLHMKKLISFKHFGNISTDLELPAINFVKTGVIYSYTLP